MDLSMPMSVELYIQVMTIPALIGILLLGKYFLSKSASRTFDLIAALLTLKPLAATPIWLMILNEPFRFANFTHAWRIALSIVPGAGLTAFIVLVFRSSFTASGISRTRILLMLDCIRWLNSFFLFVLFSTSALSNLFLPVIISWLGVLMPTIFALSACALVYEKTTQRLFAWLYAR
jgi:hypothetical protein